MSTKAVLSSITGLNGLESFDIMIHHPKELRYFWLTFLYF